MMFYANYLRFMERAAARLVGADVAGTLLRNEGLAFGLQSADGIKYSVAAVLGVARFYSSSHAGGGAQRGRARDEHNECMSSPHHLRALAGCNNRTPALRAVALMQRSQSSVSLGASCEV